VAKRLVLSGERLVLRPYRDDELDEAIEQAQQAIAQVGDVPSREALARRFEQSGHFVEGRLDLAVEGDGRLVGSIQARAPERALPPGVCELGIELVPDGRGRGFGTEAVALLAGHLLTHGYPRV
jgi:RimJ/RimL family protein N-acetyltransferase